VGGRGGCVWERGVGVGVAGWRCVVGGWWVAGGGGGGGVGGGWDLLGGEGVWWGVCWAVLGVVAWLCGGVGGGGGLGGGLGGVVLKTHLWKDAPFGVGRVRSIDVKTFLI